jgi:hypothetical protein
MVPGPADERPGQRSTGPGEGGLRLEDGAEAVGEGATLVPDLLLRAEPLPGVGVGRLVDRLLEGGEGDDLLVLGWPLTIRRTPLSALSTRKETFSETFALRLPSYSHSTPAFWQASR